VAEGPIDIAQSRLTDFCRRWQVSEMSVFGSAQREGFDPHSDVDLLLSFEDGVRRSLLDLVSMEQGLKALLGCPAYLVMCETVEQSEKYIRRERILESAELVYLKE